MYLKNIIRGEVSMLNYASLHLEEIKNQKAVSFSANSSQPEQDSWDLCRKWALDNLKDYSMRRCVGFSPVGHHPVSEDDDSHEYVAQMFLYGEEGNLDTFQGISVSEVPGGLFLVGDVSMEVLSEEGSIDIGESMKQTSQEMYMFLKESGLYDIDMDGRFFMEEHLFSDEWFNNIVKVPEYRIWLPIKVINDCK